MKLKILFLLHIPPPVHGSSMVGKYIYDSELINSAFETRYINLGTSTKVDEIGKGGLKKIIKYIVILFKTIQQLIIFRPKIGYLAMTAKGGAFYKDVIVGFLFKLFGVKLVIHFHNKGVSVNQDKKVDDFLYRKIFKNSKVILLSKYLYPDIKKYVSYDNVFYCPNGIPDLRIENIERPNSAPVNLLFLSNLIESKGVFVLLDALGDLNQKGIDFRCNFIGGEADINTERFENKVDELELSGKVFYLGKKYGNDKHEYFSNADIFVFPTFYHNETFGLVNLEAMEYSLPVISTFEGGIPDVVQDGVTGFLVQQKNIHELTTKLEVLINNYELRVDMGRKGKIRFEEKFTLQSFETNLKSILENIITTY